MVYVCKVFSEHRVKVDLFWVKSCYMAENRPFWKQTLLKLNLQDEGGSYVNGFVYILTIYRKCLPI